MSESRNLDLPYVAEAQAQKHVTVNDAFRRIDSIVQLTVTDRTRSAPPAAPAEGDRYLVAANASGAWSGHDYEVAVYVDDAWAYFDPLVGWIAFVQAEGAFAYYTGSAWEVLSAVEGFETTARLGINAAASDTNRLTVRSDSALFAPDMTQGSPSGDVRILVTKDGTGDVASHLFQTNFSGRAEFGLIGSDDFSLKVSSDGTNFDEAFRVDGNTARVDFAAVPAIGGAAALSYSVASVTALQSSSVPAAVERVSTRGYTQEGDGGEGDYQRVSVMPGDGLGVQDAAGGFWRLDGQTINPRQVGAKGNGATDDTAALNTALASNRTVFIDRGVYRVSDSLVSGGPFQRIFGDGRGRTTLRVTASFNLNANGVVEISHPFVSVSDIEIDFDQDGATSRGALRRYPPAVYLVGQPRCRLARLRFLAAWDGVDATGNTGGAILDDIESGSFHEGFRFGGALDTVELRNCRTWPYNFAGNATLLAIYGDGQNVGFRFGRVDDLKVSNCTPFQTRVIFEATDGVGPFGTVNGLALDGSNSKIEFEEGDMAITSMYCTSAIADDVFILQTGGELMLSDFSFRVNDMANVPLVHVAGPGANCLIQNGQCDLGPSVSAEGFRISAGQLSVSGVRFQVNPDVDRTAPCIHQINGSLQAFGNTINSAVSGSGDFIRVTIDRENAIFGNTCSGYDYVFPATRANGLYGPNHDGRDTRFDTPVRINDGGGSATLSGSELFWSNGLKVSRGNADDELSLAVGELALQGTTTGTANTALGRRALATLASGTANVAVGTNAANAASTANGNTCVGWNAASAITGSNNTALGRNTMTGAPASVQNSSAVGFEATVNGSNQVQLGNSSTTTYTYGAVQMRSDLRDKTDVRDTQLGLEFISRLRPVDFRWNYREDYLPPADPEEGSEWSPPPDGAMARTRFHHGFIAQDLAATLIDLDVDFGGYQDHAAGGDADVKTIGYAELIAPIVKAIQELHDRIERIEQG